MGPEKLDPISGVRIVTLGGCSVRIAGRAIDNVPTNFFKIASYIRLSSEGVVSRVALRSLLCPDDADAYHAAANVRQTLARIRAFQTRLNFRLIEASHSTVILVDDPKVAWDLSAFLAPDMDPVLAAHQYGGDLLAGIGRCSPDFEDWLADHREMLRLRVISGLETALAKLGPDDKTRAALRLLEIDRSNALAYGILMQDAAAQGNAIRVRQLFAQCDRHMREDFGISPPAAMRRFLDDAGLMA